VRRWRSAEQEAAEDVFFGQLALIWARWFVILAAAILTLWTSSAPADLTARLIPVVMLMGLNFFLHARYVLERPANPTLLAAISALDLAVITGIVLTWTGARGLGSPYFVYYYPLVLAFAFVFRPRLAGAYTAAAILLYTGACLLADPSFFWGLWSMADVKTLVVRLITLASMGGLGAYYWRVLRRHQRPAELQEAPAWPSGLGRAPAGSAVSSRG
jgi:hypothetical protein